MWSITAKSFLCSGGGCIEVLFCADEELSAGDSGSGEVESSSSGIILFQSWLILFNSSVGISTVSSSSSSVMVSMPFLAICAYVFLTFCFLRTCLLHLFICAARSLLHFLSSAVGSYVGSIISTVINEAHLVSGSSIAFAKMFSFPGYTLGPAN